MLDRAPIPGESYPHEADGPIPPALRGVYMQVAADYRLMMLINEWEERGAMRFHDGRRRQLGPRIVWQQRFRGNATNRLQRARGQRSHGSGGASL